MAGTRRIGLDSHGWATRRPAPCQSEGDVASPLARHCSDCCSRWRAPAARRPTAGRPTRAARCAPTASPRRRPTTRPRATSACTTSPIPPTATSPALTVDARRAACPTGSSRPARWPRTPGRARPRSASRRRPPTTATAPSAGATGATTSTSATSPRRRSASSRRPSPTRPAPASATSSSTTTTRPAEVAPLTNSGVEQLRVSVAHELFHAIQLGESRGRLPEWLAEATAVWMEGEVAPPDVDREIYRVALGGAGTEQPFWQHGRPPRVRRLVADLGARARPPRVRAPSADARGRRAAMTIPTASRCSRAPMAAGVLSRRPSCASRARRRRSAGRQCAARAAHGASAPRRAARAAWRGAAAQLPPLARAHGRKGGADHAAAAPPASAWSCAEARVERAVPRGALRISGGRGALLAARRRGREQRRRTCVSRSPR